MKTLCILAVLVLTLSVMTGCGCRNSKPAATTLPTTVPTETVTETTAAPTTETTYATSPTIQDGNGPMETDDPMATSETVLPDNRSRGINEGIGSGAGITGSITG